jgi:hypothetical protein
MRHRWFHLCVTALILVACSPPDSVVRPAPNVGPGAFLPTLGDYAVLSPGSWVGPTGFGGEAPLRILREPPGTTDVDGVEVLRLHLTDNREHRFQPEGSRVSVLPYGHTLRLHNLGPYGDTECLMARDGLTCVDYETRIGLHLSRDDFTPLVATDALQKDDRPEPR